MGQGRSSAGGRRVTLGSGEGSFHPCTPSGAQPSLVPGARSRHAWVFSPCRGPCPGAGGAEPWAPFPSISRVTVSVLPLSTSGDFFRAQGAPGDRTAAEQRGPPAGAISSPCSGTAPCLRGWRPHHPSRQPVSGPPSREKERSGVRVAFHVGQCLPLPLRFSVLGSVRFLSARPSSPLRFRDGSTALCASAAPRALLVIRVVNEQHRPVLHGPGDSILVSRWALCRRSQPSGSSWSAGFQSTSLATGLTRTSGSSGRREAASRG